MKAAVMRAGETALLVEELTQDEPKTGEVLIRTGAAGICASDIHVIHGTAQIPLPCVLGHEGAGTVEAVGPGVTNVKPGDRCVLSFVSNCGHCRQCRSGSPQLCETNALTGVRQYDGTTRLRDSKGDEVFQMSKLGVFSEHQVAPAQACYPMPDDVPMEVAALIGCSVTTGVGSVVNAPRVRPGMTVAVFGAGGVGLALDTFGGIETTQQAVGSLRRNGVAVVVGLAPLGDQADIDLTDMVRTQKTLTGAYYGLASPHETFRTMIDLYQKGYLLVDEIIQRRYSLDEINEAFDSLERGEDGRGVIVF